MADFEASARSNYFAVKDEAAFRSFCYRFSLEIFEGTAGTDTEGKFAVASRSDHGTWPGGVLYVEVDKCAECDGPLRLEGDTLVHVDPAPGNLPYTHDPERAEDEVDFDMTMLADHLADGEVVVLIEVGAEKMRYLGGWAMAFDNTDRSPVQVSLDEIYSRAEKAFGTDPTRAML